jgi:YHS domain-containing protein
VNKTCPVGGETVDPAVAVVMHEGKPIGFCCAECIEPFKKDPAKYAAAIK